MDTVLDHFPPLPFAAPTRLRIGVFDSGVGGLSVLQAVHRQLPEADLHYVADSGHAPYGERGDAHVLARSQRIAEHLFAQGADALVIACNTATAAAAAALRAAWPQHPLIGVEPGIKLAVERHPLGRIGVMATGGTLRSEKFQSLLTRFGVGRAIELRACTGLAAAIEAGELDDPALVALVQAHCAPLQAAGVDSVVLGCTHYVFVRHHIEAAMGPGVAIIDTAEAVARHVRTRCIGLRAPATGRRDAASVLIETTGDVARMRRIARHWLPFPATIDAAPAACR